MVDRSYTQQSADILNELIRSSRTTAIGISGSSGGPGQQISVKLYGIGTVKARCAGPVVPGKIEGRKTNEGWIVRSVHESISLDQTRRLRRGREVDKKVLAFAFLYEVEGDLYLGGLFNRKKIESPVAGQFSAGSIQHKRQSLLAIAKIGDSNLLVLDKTGNPDTFTDGRVAYLEPKGGGVWVGERVTQGPIDYYFQSSSVIQRHVVERSTEINFFNPNIEEFVVGGERDYYIRGGDPSLGPGIEISGVWWTKNIRIETLDEPYIGLGGTLIYRVAVYLDILATIQTTAEYGQQRQDTIKSYLYHDKAIAEVTGSRTYREDTIAVSTNPVDEVVQETISLIGSGSILILPGVSLPWNTSRIETLNSGPSGTTRTINEQSVEYSLPLLINNQADQAIVRKTTKTEQVSIVNGVSTGTSSQVIEYLLIRKDAPLPQALNQQPVLRAERQGTEPLLPSVGTLSFPVSPVSIPAELGVLLPDMPIVYAVKDSQNKVSKGIGTISGYTLTGASLTGLSLSITSVVRTEFDPLAKPNGVVYSNHGSLLGLFMAFPEIEQPSFTCYIWERNKIHLVNTKPSWSPKFSSDRTHQAELWLLDFTQTPIAFYKQPRSISGGKLPIAPADKNNLIPKIAGSYFG